MMLRLGERTPEKQQPHFGLSIKLLRLYLVCVLALCRMTGTSMTAAATALVQAHQLVSGGVMPRQRRPRGRTRRQETGPASTAAGMCTPASGPVAWLSEYHDGYTLRFVKM